MSQKTYRIGEAAAALNLKTYVLRFWETEFSQIEPIRTEKGQRLYAESDIAVLGRIRYLLHERGLTIDGARRLLQEEAARGVTYTHAGSPVRESERESAEDVLEDATDEPATGSSRGAASGTAVCEQVQGSLFTANADAGPAGGAPATASALADELRLVITELAAIHHLLVSDTRRDTP